jgi:uncharacterized damage-inducible protein DinB
MSDLGLLRSLFRYQAWANDELLEAMEGLDAERHNEERQIAIRLINHYHVVNQIFAAHLVGEKHSFSADNTPDTPALKDLRAAVEALDRWYLEYVESATPDLLCEFVPFVFTDGDKGCMTREEMLTHVVIHGGYHRGEVGRIMRQLSAKSAPGLRLPWDTYAVYLHKAEPLRRLQSVALLTAPEEAVASAAAG